MRAWLFKPNTEETGGDPVYCGKEVICRKCRAVMVVGKCEKGHRYVVDDWECIVRRGKNRWE